MFAAIDDPTAALRAAEGFMKYGPVGLAGLLIVLSLIALALRIDPGRERVFKTILYVGAFCFIAALVAQHFEPPTPSPQPDFSKQRSILSGVAKRLADAEPKLQEVVQMASTNGCPGGAHGIAIPHGSDMAARSSAVLQTLGDSETDLDSVIESLPGKRPSIN
jgi:hypothetical protein